jgi:hypothetical protein
MRSPVIALGWFAATVGSPSASADGVVPSRADDASAHVRAAEATERLADRARHLSRRVQTSLGEARDDGDRERAVCYDGVLSQINSTARHLDQVRADLGTAPRHRDRHHLVVRTFARRLDELARVAARCGGADAPLPDQTIVEVTVLRADRPVVVRSYRMPARNAAQATPRTRD